MDYRGENKTMCAEMMEGPMKVAEPEYEAFWDARMQFQRAMDLAENARHTSGAVRVYRLSLALAQEKIQAMANAVKLLEIKAQEDEERLQVASSW